MNGRIYDPDLGRFLQPDPVIQAPNNAQSWNAYTYVFNNPLRYTDPTGMIGIEERQWAGAAVAIVMTAIYPGNATMWYSMLTGMVAGWVSTGNMQGAITGAISAGLFAGIGSYFETARWANAPSGSGAFGSGLTWGGYGAKTLSHGVAGGVMSSMQGGKFGHGFASAGSAQAFSPMINHFGANAPARIAASAIVGGAASHLSGGRFASGAITAAFSRAFNEELHSFFRHEGETWADHYTHNEEDVMWPTDHEVVTSGFGRRNVPGGSRNHKAVDVRARLGNAIYSIQSGTIMSVGAAANGRGEVFVQNDDGSISGYAHVGAINGISEGMKVSAGQQIATSNGSGLVRNQGPHLHYTYRPGSSSNPATLQTAPVNPITYQLHRAAGH